MGCPDENDPLWRLDFYDGSPELFSLGAIAIQTISLVQTADMGKPISILQSKPNARFEM